MPESRQPPHAAASKDFRAAQRFVISTIAILFVLAATATSPAGAEPDYAVERDAMVHTITIYAAGLGAVDPILSAGQVPSSSVLSTTVQSVAASIGGVPTRVLWAGAAPGLIGIYQVNVLVENQVPSGSRLLVISTAGNASQAAVTIEIQ